IHRAGCVFGTCSTRLSDDAMKIQQLEATVADQSTKIAMLKRDLSFRDRSLADLQIETQRKANDAHQIKSQLLDREVELEPPREQLNAAMRGKVPQDEF